MFLSTICAAPTYAEDPAPENCLKRVVVEGYLRPSQPLAELNAIQMWLEEVSKENPPYAMWHNAQGKAMKCETVGALSRTKCTLTARPCKSPDTPAGSAALPKG